MAEYLKSDCINNAYQELRISGLTVQPQPNENVTALRKLEAMAAEFKNRNVCVGYNFEEAPDLNSSAGIPIEYQESFELCLAVRLVSIFGKGAADKIDQVLFQRESGAWSYLSGMTAPIQLVQPSGRMPIGSGNERYGTRYSKFYKPSAVPDPGCATNRMIIGEIEDYIQRFDVDLIDSEEVASYVITSNNGLTVVSDSLSSDGRYVNYRIKAVGDATDNPDGLYQVKIVATTDKTRVITKLIDFYLTEAKIA